MKNYKIKVNDEAESKEAQELFFELGFQWYREDKGVFWKTTTGFIFANDGTKLLFGGVFGDADTYTPITLPQLRDLVVLKRNDVRDATHVDQEGTPWTCVDFDIRFGNWWTGHHWRKSEFSFDFILKPIQPDQGLISGAEAMRALADGDKVEFNSQNKWLDIRKYPWDLNIILNNPDGIKFRLKPRTIKLEIEIPAPFEPKDGERYFYINPHADAGYGENTTTKWSKYLQFGSWRTKEEIKQVVAALRGIKG